MDVPGRKDFGQQDGGAVSQFTYAKQLFTAPMAVLAQAAGAASMPFFASLWAQEKRYEFATSVADSVSRVMSLGLLAASAMVALAVPLVDLIYVGGKFSAGDAGECAAYFAAFSISISLWSAQAIYSRAFYAAGNTFLPMAAGTIITLASLPVYDALYHAVGAMGLAAASDIGITAQTVALALLLHRRRMVSLASLDFSELGRCLLAAVAAGIAVWLACIVLVGKIGHIAGSNLIAHSRWVDFAVLLAGSALWLAIVKVVLEKIGSALPRVAMKRLKLG